MLYMGVSAQTFNFNCGPSQEDINTWVSEFRAQMLESGSSMARYDYFEYMPISSTSGRFTVRYKEESLLRSFIVAEYGDDFQRHVHKDDGWGVLHTDTGESFFGYEEGIALQYLGSPSYLGGTTGVTVDIYYTHSASGGNTYVTLNYHNAIDNKNSARIGGIIYSLTESPQDTKRFLFEGSADEAEELTGLHIY